MSYFASFLREIFVDERMRFAYNSHQL